MLDNFINPQQLEILRCTQSEEYSYFQAINQDISNRITKMPVTYEQDGKGNNAIAYLHYFTGGCDWYITEKDIEPEQLQAFGYANIGYGYEAGYISIKELLENNVELDFHFEPKPIKNLV